MNRTAWLVIVWRNIAGNFVTIVLPPFDICIVNLSHTERRNMETWKPGWRLAVPCFINELNELNFECFKLNWKVKFRNYKKSICNWYRGDTSCFVYFTVLLKFLDAPLLEVEKTLLKIHWEKYSFLTVKQLIAGLSFLLSEVWTYFYYSCFDRRTWKLNKFTKLLSIRIVEICQIKLERKIPQL